MPNSFTAAPEDVVMDRSIPATLDEASTFASRSNHCHLGGYDDYTPLYTTIDSVIFAFSLVGNLLVIISVKKFQALRTTTNMFVLSLALADLLVCLSIPFYMTFYFDVPYLCQKYPCLVRYATTIYSMVVSVLLLVGVAADRYVAVVHPFTYHAWICKRRVTSVICGIYVYVLVIIVLIMGSNTWKPGIPECDLGFVVEHTHILLFVGFHVLFTMVVDLFLYTCIFRVAWRQVRTVRQVTACVHDPMMNSRIHHEIRTALTMALVLGVHVLSLAPFLIVITIRSLEDDGDSLQPPPLSKTKKFCMCLFFAKSSINPVIYAWKNADFRCAFKKLTINKCR